MLGEILGEERGQITAMRVLPSNGRGARVEVSFQASGTILGHDSTDVVTYYSEARPDGTMFGEGQGVIMTADGETVTFTGRGFGRFTRPGAVAWRGALYYETASRKLARLNGTVGVFEFESDEGGKTEGKVWEWK